MLRQVGIAIVIDGDKFLILKRSDKVGGSRGFWNFPGGSVEEGESYDVAAARELQEEAGLVVDPKDLEYIGEWRRGDLALHHFITDKFSGKVTINYESSDFAWVTLDELDNYLFVGGGVVDSEVKKEILDWIE